MLRGWTVVIHWILLIHHIDVILSAKNPRLLIISLDGFCHSYLQKYSLPTLNRIQNEGIKTVHGMQPTFVTMTFPNHISIATGMYQEDHGIIHNRFFDKKLQKLITFGTRNEGQWNGSKAEPIWITATKQNKKSAVLFWPAAHIEFNGVRPLIYSWMYSDLIPLREKIDNAIAYFKDISFDFVMLYHFEPDKHGHVFGPDSNETRDALVRIDSDLDYLLTKVKNELDNDLNIIILSDHGMTNTVRFVQPFLEGYINQSTVEENILDGPLFSVTPRSGYFDHVFNGLRRIPNVTVYRRDEFPERFHYKKAINRLGEIIVVPNNEGTVFSQLTSPTNTTKGNHGYDHTLPSMQAIFMAHGPDFKPHTEIHSVKNVDVYHIACQILHLEPNTWATAGSLNNLTHIFRERTNESSRSMMHISIVVFVVFLNFIM